ncbi:MAG: glycosyltransferase family 39 protein [Candidatus Aminicenantes bacterium]|nr:glycosyltransferase family 39 protein [Candidatus Aminicenantes bacterium]
MRFLPGIGVILLVGFIYVLAYLKSRRSKYALALALIILCSLILRVYLSWDLYLHDWDERYHALVAKNMIGQPLKPMLYRDPVLPYDYRNWFANHVWIHKPPLPLWTMAAGMSLLGVNEAGLRFPSIVLSTLAVLLTYGLGRRLFSRRVGLLAAFLHSIHGMIIELTAGKIATDHVDLFFLFFVELAVYLVVVQRKRKTAGGAVLIGLAVGLAILCKWLPALTVIALWVILDMDFLRPRSVLHLAVILAVMVLVALPWQLYIRARFPAETAWETLFNLKHITQVLDGQGGPITYHLRVLVRSYGELILLPLVWLSVQSFRKLQDRKRLFLLAWIAIPVVVFSFFKTKMQAYTVFAAPALFLLTAVFFYYLKGTIRKRKPRWLASVCLVLLIGLPVRYSIDRLRFFRPEERSPQWVLDIKKLRGTLPDKTVIFNHRRPIEVMFYTDYVAYDHAPSDKEKEIVLRKGYALAVVDGPNLPPALKADQAVIHLK